MSMASKTRQDKTRQDKTRQEEYCIICHSMGDQIAQNVRQVPGCGVFYCGKCDLAFLELKYLNRDEKKFYNEVYPQEINPQHKGDSPLNLTQKRLDLCLKYLGSANNQKVLEIGSASGHFLNMVRDYVGSVTGCDLNQQHCLRAKEQYGIESLNCDVQEIKDTHQFDVIFMFQLFEHIATPHVFLDKVYSLLKNDGLLILDVPNISEALFRLYGLKPIKEGFFFKLQHPFTYSEKALKKIMGIHRFSCVEIVLIQNYSITNHLNWIYLQRGNTTLKDGMSVLFDNLNDNAYKDIWEKLDFEYKNLLIKKGFSDIIFAVFKKD